MKKNNSRAVGNAYERQIRLEFRAMGWDTCETTRYASHEIDGKSNIDLVRTKPFNIQVKRWSHAPAYQEVLKSMPQDENYNIIIHKKPNRGEVVVMDKSSFYEIIQMLKVNQII